MTKRFFWAGWVLAGLLFLAGCAAQRPLRGQKETAAPVVRLQRILDRIYADSLLDQAQCAIKVKSMDTGDVLYQRNSHLLFPPASNLKLLTTAAALYKLGPDYRFKTILATDSAAWVPGDTVLHGNLYLKGGGDPLLNTDDLLKMADYLRSLPLRRIEGRLLADATFHDSLELGKGWMWDDEPYPFSAHLSALTLNENCVTFVVRPGEKTGAPLKVAYRPRSPEISVQNLGQTCDTSDTYNLTVERDVAHRKNVFTVRGTYPVGALPDTTVLNVENPALFAVSVFASLLKRKGVACPQGYGLGELPANAETLFVHTSPALAQVVRHTNKISDNLAAELILKTLGAEQKGPPGSAEKGLQVVREFLQQIHVDSTTYHIVDGSGLSRYNLITADLIVALLDFMYHTFPVQPEFLASLPIGGLDGTLSDRLKEQPAFKNVRAKTGTMEGVSSLSGYVATADGEILAFSILMQNFLGPPGPYRELQDRICNALASFSRKAGKSDWESR